MGKLTIEKNLDFYDYILAVRTMSDAYFNQTNGLYEPYFGELNVIRMFFDLCVKESEFNDDFPNGIMDYEGVTVLVKDKDFMNAFNDAIKDDTNEEYFTFSRAYRMAMDMVETKKTSFGQTASIVSDAIQAIMNKLGTLLSEENMEYIKTISAEIAKGGFTADDIVKAYGESKRFKEVVNAEKVDE